MSAQTTPAAQRGAAGGTDQPIALSERVADHRSPSWNDAEPEVRQQFAGSDATTLFVGEDAGAAWDNLFTAAVVLAMVAINSAGAKPVDAPSR